MAKMDTLVIVIDQRGRLLRLHALYYDLNGFTLSYTVVPYDYQKVLNQYFEVPIAFCVISRRL